MESPFSNDIFGLIWKAFKNLYPDKNCACEWAPELEKSEDGYDVFGQTFFSDDGECLVQVSAKLPVVDAAEVFAHELAHVAAGNEANHGSEWEKAFDDIFNEYNRLGNLDFETHDPVSVTSGKDYVRG